MIKYSKKDIMKLTPTKISRINNKNELRQLVIDANRYVNLQKTNIKRYINSGKITPNIARDMGSEKSIYNKKYDIKLNPKSNRTEIEQYRDKLKNAVKFLQGETTHIYSSKYTDKTFLGTMNKFFERLNVKPMDISQEENKEYWNIYHELYDISTDTNYSTVYDSTQFQKQLYDVMFGGDTLLGDKPESLNAEDIKNLFVNKFEEIYINKQRQDNEFTKSNQSNTFTTSKKRKKGN